MSSQVKRTEKETWKHRLHRNCYRFQKRVESNTKRDTRTEEIMTEQLCKLMLIPPSTGSLSMSPRPYGASLSSGVPGLDASKSRAAPARIWNMIGGRRRQVERWAVPVCEARKLAALLDAEKEEFAARHARQAVYMYRAKLNDAEDDLNIRMRLLRRAEGSTAEVADSEVSRARRG
ncbi:hypothetical protein BKA67DRAFT_656808 [Truncatella angustata]|uniref:Uncharacterized protein n=1 Tax=Truncatella angustata TaxID=152316 RepID=A0A9P9A213_9PEZI|nr:uncharacterized protein BKA67DRAFT_656808 [Truncatella angustata]KAH6658654.1 hypothetical protein BKA67DRAFT_656808 [Truncatella angustata]